MMSFGILAIVVLACALLLRRLLLRHEREELYEREFRDPPITDLPSIPGGGRFG